MKSKRSLQCCDAGIWAVVEAGSGVLDETVAGCNVVLRELGAWDRVWRLDTIDEVAPNASWVFATGRGESSWSPRGLVFNASAVAVTTDTSRRLLTSLEHRLREKAKAVSQRGQLPDGCAGICAISLGDVRAEQASEVIDGATQLVASRRDLSALVLSWSEG